MKTNKTVLKLAESISRDNDDIHYVYSELMNLRNAMLNGNYYTWVEIVSSNGMSRTIGIGYVKNNKFRRILNAGILKLAGCNKNGGIDLCGMDVLFAAQKSLFDYLCPKMNHQDKMVRYNNITG